MRTRPRLRFATPLTAAALLAVCLVSAAPSSAEEFTTTLREAGGARVTLDTGSGSCPAVVPVTLRVDREDQLRDRQVLAAAIRWAQFRAAALCPKSDEIALGGEVGGQRLYQGRARKADGWMLVDARSTSGPVAVSPSAPVSGSAAIARCDALAGHPDDPEGIAAGVTDEVLDSIPAIRACEAALKVEPKTPRLHFQLARAYLKADRFEDATEHLLDAAEEDHGGALAYLGDLHVGGAPGIEPDPILARSLYERAVASGFTPAEEILREFEDMTDEYDVAEKVDRQASAEAKATPPAQPPSKVAATQSSQRVDGPSESLPAPSPTVTAAAGPLKPYQRPEIIEGILNRRFDTITTDEKWTKEYLYFIADNLQAICESGLSKADVERLKVASKADPYRIGQASIGAAASASAAAIAGVMRNPIEAMKRQAATKHVDPFDVGMKDTEALFQRHACNTPGILKFGKNLSAYVLNEDAPLPPQNGIINACLGDTPPSKYKPADFCRCFAGGLKMARVSQADRRDLLVQFQPAATRIMNIDVNQPQFNACRTGF